MTEEFDIIGAFQRIRQRLHDTQQPRNLGLVAEALQEPRLVQDNFMFTAPSLPPGRLFLGETLQELRIDDDDENDEELFDIMDCMAWAYMPDEIQKEICSRFYKGIPATHQILLTIPNEDQSAVASVTAATVKIRRDNHTVHLLLDNEVIAWYTAASSRVDDKYHPIFFVYDYGKLGRFFLGAAQILWNALGYPVCIESERYIWDDETTPWETADDAELRDCVHNRIKQFGQLSGNSGWLKPKIRNARRRKSLL